METTKTEKNASTSTSKEKRERERTYTQEELDTIVAEAVKKAMANIIQQPTQTVLKIERVTLVYLGAIASGTVVALGKLGYITKAGSPLTVKKEDFLQAMGTPVVDDLLRKRALIVIDGFTPEEMEKYNLAYKEGELLTTEMFFKILSFQTEEAVNIFRNLCKEHKLLMAKIYNTAYFENHDSRLNTDTMKKLNEVSKETIKEGLFTRILEDMGKRFAE